ncbi:hypothetical protein IFM89_014898 [Coptis chinensis]|uniref:Protein FAR1-RELATED SEQUENCE n=1 Tax=Coptis chinensis TaxID=261450 RepID=A0A835H8E5_9MAGN|nr:hypothetical protein IFM89_014898 [Coptis chinensis]
MEEDLDSQKEAVPAAIGMEFDSYDDVYNFYNCYAKEQGFGIRVQKSWCRRLSKEKFKAVLCCSNEGFTKKRSVNSRTGCPAMVRIRLVVRRALNKAVYDSLRVDEFETIWKEMVEQCGVGDHEWLQTLYHDQKQWVPVFLKESPFAEKKRTIEAREDFDSLHSKPILKTKCCFELQMSRFYTKEIFRKFQHEVEELYSCFNTSQVHSDGPIVTYVVKERCEGEGNQREVKKFEVLYNTEKQEVSCICGLFNFKGYLCRHTLSVLNYNGVEEIPSHYIISRWRKDYKHSRIVNAGANSDEVDNRDQWSACLYKYAVQIVEEGAISQEHYKAALLTLEESLKKVCLAEEIESRMVPTTSQRSTT